MKLSWRIPTAGDPRLLRLALAQIGLASVVAGLVLAATMPTEWLAPALAGLVPLAIFMAYRRWRRFQDSLVGETNIWLDEDGLRWLDTSGREHAFRRAEVTGFSIGDSQETLRAIAALTLYLKGGFESQPIELYPPATITAVRGLLADQWKLAECSPAREGLYDVRVEVFSECHAEFQEWHWEGTREALIQWFNVMADAARELPPPPPGVRPLSRVLLANRRHPMRIAITNSSVAYLDDDQIAAPREVLETIANSALRLLAENAVPDVKYDVPLGPRSRWTFHLHVRE